MPEEVLCRHGHVRLELADPDAVGPLQLEQAARATLDRGVESGQLRNGHQAVTLADWPLKMC